MDFTLKKYRQLLEALLAGGYRFQTYKDFIESPNEGKTIVLRHDVDLKPQNSLATARLENELGLQATYYFRAVPESWDETIIKDIASMGHEVGYHYESLTTCNGNTDAAYHDFCQNLAKLRELLTKDKGLRTKDEGQRTKDKGLRTKDEVHSSSLIVQGQGQSQSLSQSRLVSTICMHGSPRSPYDSKDIWKKYSYKELDIIAEPYLDTDWSKTFYLTDTGRRWDGFNVSVRDKIPEYQDQWTRAGYVFHSTDDIIKALQSQSSISDTSPFSPHAHIMITTHPQRWTDKPISWLKELLLQNAKNGAKKLKVNKFSH